MKKSRGIMSSMMSVLQWAGSMQAQASCTNKVLISLNLPSSLLASLYLGRWVHVSGPIGVVLARQGSIIR